MPVTAENGRQTPAYSVVIIEDDPLILDILVYTFKKQHWAIETAQDGEAGLEVIVKTKPNIVMLDIGLPGMNGYEVLTKLKSSEEHKHIPVVMLSNFGQPEEIAQSISLGAVDHLIKANVIIDTVVDVAKAVVDGTYTRKV